MKLGVFGRPALGGDQIVTHPSPLGDSGQGCPAVLPQTDLPARLHR